MRHFLNCSLAAVSTLLVGIGVFIGVGVLSTGASEFVDVDQPSLEAQSTELSGCEVREQARNLKNTLVRFRAQAWMTPNERILLTPLAPLDCDSEVLGIRWFELDVNEFSGKNNNLNTLLENKPTGSGYDRTNTYVDVEIIGRIAFINEIGGFERYSVQPSRIELISRFRKATGGGGYAGGQ